MDFRGWAGPEDECGSSVYPSKRWQGHSISMTQGLTGCKGRIIFKGAAQFLVWVTGKELEKEK